MRKKVAWMKKAENMLECVAVLDNGPLSVENFELFYTPFKEPYRIDIVRQLNFRLEAAVRSGYPYKFLLAGHRGVGKSTELLRVSTLCEGYETIFVNAADAMGPKGTSYTNLLVLIADRVMEFGVSKGYLDINDPAFIPLVNYWNSEVQLEKMAKNAEGTNVSTDAKIEGKSSLSSSFKLLKALKTSITLGVKLDVDTGSKISQLLSVDEIIHTVIDKNDMLFVEAFNFLLRKLRGCMEERPLLIIVEELDKAGQFEAASDAFGEHIRAFIGIEASMIFTYPVHLQYDPEYFHVRDMFNDIFKLGVVELLNKDRKYNPDVIEALKELIYKRILSDLIEESALELAIKMSGGLLRDVFALLSEAAVIAGISSREKILVSDVERAVASLEERYVKVIKIDNGFDKLVSIYNDPRHQMDEDLRELLRVEAVLEYSGNRYFVHPVVLKFLHDIRKPVKEYE